MTKMKRFEDPEKVGENCEALRPREGCEESPYSDPEPGVVGGVLASDVVEDDACDFQYLSIVTWLGEKSRQVVIEEKRASWSMKNDTVNFRMVAKPS